MDRILLIDDEEFIREGLGKLLELKGYKVDTASNGKSALNIMKSIIPDLIITDIIMPDFDGIELILKVKQIYPDVKIIAISGGGRINADNHLAIASQLGADKVLIKPFSSDELILAISALSR